jgi:hypothetical protein
VAPVASNRLLVANTRNCIITHPTFNDVSHQRTENSLINLVTFSDHDWSKWRLKWYMSVGAIRGHAIIAHPHLLVWVTNER